MTKEHFPVTPAIRTLRDNGADFTLHAYQGPAYAYGAALWSLGNILVFLAARSVIPLILAHTFFDFVLAGGLWDSDSALSILALLATASGTVLVLQHRAEHQRAAMPPPECRHPGGLSRRPPSMG